MGQNFRLARFGGMSGMGDMSAAVEKLDLWETENRSGILITVEDKPG